MANVFIFLKQKNKTKKFLHKCLKDKIMCKTANLLLTLNQS